jgi:MFS transporter, ACS family, glucarate transporter
MIPKRYWLVFGTFLLSMLLYVDRVCIAVAGTSVSTDLQLTSTQFSWVLSAFALGYALCQTPSGILADRFGPRRILTAVVTFWSLFTGLTAMAWNLTSLLLFRVLFGAGEAGAFPGCARAFYSWLPISERGLAHGINFSGSRLGAAFALPVVAAMVSAFGWRQSFVVLAVVGFAWAIFWYNWFRDRPEDDPRISEAEKSLILSTRQQASSEEEDAPPLTTAALVGSRNMWLVSFQYFCSNYTFFFCLSWMFPYLEEKYQLGGIKAGLYGSIPLLCGAAGNWVSGAMVDAIYRRGHWNLSRRLPAILGFVLVVVGLSGIVWAPNVASAIACLSIAIFGADMTLSPSWSLCIDIGRRNAGAVSGTMNMAGNIGAFITPLAFAYLKAWTGTTDSFFYLGTGLSVLAIFTWLMIRPQRPLEEW